MIKVTMLKENTNIVGYEVKGHANYAGKGEDIVCAAVSVISQTILLALKNIWGMGEGKIDFEIKDGHLKVNTTSELNAEELIKTQLLMDTLELGIKAIEEDYPKYVKLKTREFIRIEDAPMAVTSLCISNNYR